MRTLGSFVLMPLAFLWIYLAPSHVSIFVTQLIVLLSTASFDPATPLVIRSFAIQSRFSRYSKAWALAKAMMYLSTGYLTFYIHMIFGLWGVLGLLMFFSMIFGISLYFFVPYNEMEERYKNMKLAGLSKYNQTSDFFNHKDEGEKTTYHNEYLKRWIDK